MLFSASLGRMFGHVLHVESEDSCIGLLPLFSICPIYDFGVKGQGQIWILNFVRFYLITPFIFDIQ